MPLRGLLGTDVLRNRPDWRVIDNPFQTGDPLVALPALRPDFALFHAPLADRFGNVFIGRQRELMLMAHAAHRTLVTVEALTDSSLLDDEMLSGSVLPAIYVSGIAVAKGGARPLAFLDQYPDDEALLARYVALAGTAEGFDRFLSEWLEENRALA